MPTEHAARPAVVFAHPSEAEIARLLDFYGMRWEYEPRSFPLEWDAQGCPTAAFTPDFYLPDYDIFLEVTTIKPALANRKNRKLRKLRALYPDVTIKLLTLKDVEALFLKFAGNRAAEAGAEPAIKNLSDVHRPTDYTEERPPFPAASSVSTDLATHQERSKHQEP
jgi:hypoxanthine phosphoribosyltransferase